MNTVDKCYFYSYRILCKRQLHEQVLKVCYCTVARKSGGIRVKSATTPRRRTSRQRQTDRQTGGHAGRRADYLLVVFAKIDVRDARNFRR